MQFKINRKPVCLEVSKDFDMSFLRKEFDLFIVPFFLSCVAGKYIFLYKPYLHDTIVFLVIITVNSTISLHFGNRSVGMIVRLCIYAFSVREKRAPYGILVERKTNQPTTLSEISKFNRLAIISKLNCSAFKRVPIASLFAFLNFYSNLGLRIF